jgi:hypothetical protein
MKVLTFILTLLACVLSLLMLATTSHAQNGDSIRVLTLKAKVTDVDGVITRHYIHSVTDTGMFLMQAENSVLSEVNPASLIQMKPTSINVVSVRKKNQIARGLATGAITGAIVGGMLGLAAGSGESGGGFDLGPGAYALGGALGGAAIGGVLGVAFSISSKNYKVNGQENKYIKMQNRINKKLLKKKKKI